MAQVLPSAGGADVIRHTLQCQLRSVLDMVASRGHVDIARMIIEPGADVNATGTEGLTLPFLATVSGCYRCI